ncbi:MAG TPA: hypothetical protein DDX54_04495 [Rhodospirillaceae bacterium]|nr:hypothetical protein [Rhodospirillaceae bacterium]
MITTLIIARHGNTFAPGAEPRRVGGRTDLPLVAKGRAQAQALGRTLGALTLPPLPQGMTLRRLGPQEWAVYRDLRLASLVAHPEYFSESHADSAAFPPQEWQKRLHENAIFALFDGTRPVGLTAVKAHKKDPKGRTAYFYHSFLVPAYRGRGLARLLYAARFAWAQAQPALTRVVVDHVENNARSRRLILAHGFRYTHTTEEKGARTLHYALDLRDAPIVLTKPIRVLCSPLARARETAAVAVRAAGWRVPLRVHPLLTEIDHGPDENRPESAVLARIGREALTAWEEDALPPPGWRVDPADLRRRWLRLANALTGTTLIVTSNGIARFAPAAGGKLATGAFGIITRDSRQWRCAAWNLRPPLRAVAPPLALR